ncbi:MAG: hypothetical protein OEL83_19885 [Desulforhopalus sp.]|nr:hypothetical protein [Desulforhopalus sp.]
MQKPEKTIVAVHGIGNQTAFDTVQAVVKQFCKHYGQPATVSLGRLDSEIRSTRNALVLSPPLDPQLPLNVAFTEVYWADIARGVENKGYQLEDTRNWARTVIERLKLHQENNKLFTLKDYELIKLVLQEIINAISVSEVLMTVFKHVGAYKPKLENVLTNYLGDVQLMTEFRVVRELILAEFDKAMTALYNYNPATEIYILAHSEGTVISFLGLLRALRQDSGAVPQPSWIDTVKGFVTLGSPIDKHLVLWPELRTEFESSGGTWKETLIRWHNYSDLGDPVGFKLDTARDWLQKIGCGCFDFPEQNDFSFTRSYLPGKAHVDYMTDTQLFGHIINTVIDPQPDQPDPKSNIFAKILNYILPYAAAFVPLLVGTYLLYQAVDKYMCYTEPNLSIVLNSLLIALLLSGTTALSRVVRLSRRWLAQLFALVFYLATTCLVIQFVSLETRANIGKALSALLGYENTNMAIFAASVLIAACGLLSRRYSLKPLLFGGFFVVMWVVGYIVFGDKLVLSSSSVVTMAIAFFCLWWLSAILFDLSFIWHMYIRNNRAVDKLHEVYISELSHL